MKPRFIALTAVVLSLASTAPAQRGRTTAVPPAELSALASKCGSLVAWEKNDPVLLEEGANRAEVVASKKAASEFSPSAAMAEALKKAEESKRLVLWYVPRITATFIPPVTATEPAGGGRSPGNTGHQMYRPAVLDGYVNAVLFSDPDCADLMNRKFVPVRLRCDAELGKQFNISAPTMTEPAFFFIAPGGKSIRSVDSLRSFNAVWFHDLMVGVLATQPELNAPSAALAEAEKNLTAGSSQPLAVAEEALRDAEFDRAATLAKSVLAEGKPETSAAADLMLARIARRTGQTADALGCCDAAMKAGSEVTAPARAESDDEAPPRRGSRGRPKIADAVDCERGRIFLADRRIDEAKRAFAAVKAGPRKAEAQYLLGVCEAQSRNDTLSPQRWKEAAAQGAENPWAWRAAANLVDGADRTPLGPTVHGFEDFFRPDPASLAASSSAIPRDPAAVEKLAKGAIDYLLRLQRESGGWTDSRYAYWPTPDLTPNAWVAATVLSCTALLEWRDADPERVDEALRRGEAYAFDEGHMNRGFNEEIYADGYKLLYLARKYDLTRNEDARKIVAERMTKVVRDLERTQFTAEGRGGPKSAGFWAHEYPNPFSTAAVMNSLHLAKQRGATVPASMMQAGAKALLSVRAPDGAYSYGAGRDVPDDPKIQEKTRAERMKNSMARSPVCEAATLWAGDQGGNTEKVAAAMENFWNYFPRFEKIRRCDFHTDGELAGFFWWHAIFHTTEAVKALPAEAQAEHNAKILKVLLRLGELDGSFIDSHEMGKSYGTAMGLLSLKNVLKDRKP